MKESPLIRKASGAEAQFSEKKLARSLERAGAGPDLIGNIVREIEGELYEGMSTQKIYQRAFAMLRKHSKSTAGRYKVKQALMELGPTGYPFEKFVAEILEYQGYRTNSGVIVQGHCVTHEVDVEAWKDDRHFMIECKFHNRAGYKCDVKVPLYIKSRYEDVRKQWMKHEDHAEKFHEGWVVTNTHFTEDAIAYGKCAGLRLIGWDYPERGSLSDRINLSGLHPLTCLSTLSKHEKQQLLEMSVVLTRDLCDNPSILEKVGISGARLKKIVKEGREICFESQSNGSL